MLLKFHFGNAQNDDVISFFVSESNHVFSKLHSWHTILPDMSFAMFCSLWKERTIQLEFKLKINLLIVKHLEVYDDLVF